VAFFQYLTVLNLVLAKSREFTRISKDLLPLAGLREISGIPRKILCKLTQKNATFFPRILGITFSGNLGCFKESQRILCTFFVRELVAARTPRQRLIREHRSVVQALKEELNTSKPRQAVDKSENTGGIFGVGQSSALPRNVKQAYNIKQQLKEGAISDPYYALVLQCKEDDKAKETTYVRKVVAPPEPAAVLASDWQKKDTAKFCTNPKHSPVFQVDLTLDLGPFSVMATECKHILLVNRQSRKHPVMVGPLLVHQKKEKLSFKLLVDFLVDKKPRVKNLRALGADVDLFGVQRKMCLCVSAVLCNSFYGEISLIKWSH